MVGVEQWIPGQGGGSETPEQPGDRAKNEARVQKINDLNEQYDGVPTDRGRSGCARSVLRRPETTRAIRKPVRTRKPQDKRTASWAGTRLETQATPTSWTPTSRRWMVRVRYSISRKRGSMACRGRSEPADRRVSVTLRALRRGQRRWNFFWLCKQHDWLFHWLIFVIWQRVFWEVWQPL